MSLRAIDDYDDILRRPWRGEMVSYDGPAGRYPNMATIDLVTFRRHPSFWLFRR